MTPCGYCLEGDHHHCSTDANEAPGAVPCSCWKGDHTAYPIEELFAGGPRVPRGAPVEPLGLSQRYEQRWDSVLATAKTVARDRAALIERTAKTDGAAGHLRDVVELVLIEFAARRTTPHGQELVESMARESRRPQDAPPAQPVASIDCPSCKHRLTSHGEDGCAAGDCYCVVSVIPFPQDAPR